MTGPAIRDLPTEERPRERLLQKGASALTAAELLAIIIGSGTRGFSAIQLAHILLARFGGVKAIGKAAVEELCEIKGLGKTKAIQIQAAIQLGAYGWQEEALTRTPLRHPKQVAALLRELVEVPEERVVALLKDVKGYLIRQVLITIGTLSESPIHPREVFFPAIRHKAASVILVHNHPSGDPSPSASDRAVTRDLIAAGVTLGIPLDDHIILAKQGYCSLRQKGICVFEAPFK